MTSHILYFVSVLFLSISCVMLTIQVRDLRRDLNDLKETSEFQFDCIRRKVKWLRQDLDHLEDRFVKMYLKLVSKIKNISKSHTYEKVANHEELSI